MSDPDRERLSPSRLGTYAKCPRLYEYRYELGVNRPDDTKRYRQQGRVMHETIERVATDSEPEIDGTVVYRRAMDAFDRSWDRHVDRSEFESAAYFEYFYRLGRAAIAAFFDPDTGAGIDHVRRAVATETWLSVERDDITLRGKADIVLETDDGLHIIDYKRGLGGMLSSRTADRLRGHLDGDVYEPTRVGNAVQAATYIEGLRESELYEPETEVRFSFYGLLAETDFESHHDGYRVTVRGREREITRIYRDHAETIWALIDRLASGIHGDRFTPEPWDDIFADTCGECAFRPMCADYIQTEVGY